MKRLAEGLGWLVYAGVALIVIALPDRLVEPFLDALVRPFERDGGAR